MADTESEVTDLSRARRRVQRRTTQARLRRLRPIICDEARFQIVQALGEGAMSVSELARVIQRKVPATSQHLRTLRELGIVEGARRRNTVSYRLHHGEATDEVLALVATLEGTPQPAAGEC